MDQTISYFDILFLRCGLIGYLLWVLSILTAGLIVRFFLVVRRSRLIPPTSRRQLSASGDARSAKRVCTAGAGLLGDLVAAGLAEAEHGYAAMERAMEEAAEARTAQLLRSIEWLHLIGNVGPMLGLTGTVWGMIRAFFTIVQTGGMPDPAALAGAIGVALVTTLLGLSVAIPALSVYAILRSRIDAVAGEAMVLAQETISRLARQEA
jgi:biopolymer transport protein ExbB